MNNKTIGIFFAILAALSLSVMCLFVRFAFEDHANISTILFVRFGVGLLVLLPLLGMRKQSLRLQKRGLTVIRALAGVAAMFGFYVAMVHIDMANAMMIQNINPAFIPIIVFCFLGIRTSWKAIIGIVICLIGIGLIIHPNPAHLNLYAFAALVGSFFTAIALVTLRQIRKVNSTNGILFYYFMIATLAGGLLAIFNWRTPTLLGWINMIIIGLIGVGYQMALTQSMKHLPSRMVAPIMLVSVVFSLLLDLIFYHVIPTPLALLGMLIAVVGVIIVVLFTQASESQTAANASTK